MTTSSIPDSIFELPIEDRITLADRLYASVPADWQREVDEAWLAEAEHRADEMDATPGSILTDAEFRTELAAIRSRR